MTFIYLVHMKPTNAPEWEAAEDFGESWMVVRVCKTREGAQAYIERRNAYRAETRRKPSSYHISEDYLED